jgi:hypothetical protein
MRLLEATLTRHSCQAVAQRRREQETRHGASERIEPKLGSVSRLRYATACTE